MVDAHDGRDRSMADEYKDTVDVGYEADDSVAKSGGSAPPAATVSVRRRPAPSHGKHKRARC